MAIREGLTGTHVEIVEDRHLGDTNGLDGVYALTNPWLTLFCEMACHNAVFPDFAPGQGSVGTRVSLSHLALVPAGRTVTVTARLVEVERRRLHFQVAGEDGQSTFVRGEHERFLVDLDQFLESL